jgi:cytochrome c biogenesis protein CcdA
MLAGVGGAWVVQANSYGRLIALVVLALFGLALLWPRFAEVLTRPFVDLGNRLSAEGEAGSGVISSFLLGVATGLLWAPCAGPILGIVLAGAALQGANVKSALLLLAYAAGAATSLAIVLLAGNRLFSALKGSLGASEWIRRGLGALVLVAVIAIAFGLDTGFLTRISAPTTTSLEQRLLDSFRPPQTVAGGPSMMMAGKIAPPSGVLPVEGSFPSLTGATSWINSPPLTPDGLKGKVVLVDFWTYSCINCLRTLPYIRAWAEKYKYHGLVIIGVHTPDPINGVFV